MDKKTIIREFGLSTLAVNNRTSVLILIFIILIMGAGSYTNMPKENFPEVKIPQVYVGVPYPGNSPLDIENLILRPIEKEINTITGVTKITSNATQDFGSIQVEFDFDTDVDEAVVDVKDAVDRAKSDLPNDLDREPNVFEIDFSKVPVLNINISGNDFAHDDLKFYAEYLQEEIENLKEISEAEIKGAKDKEVRVSIDKNLMEALEISFRNIEEAIDFENRTVSGGDLLTDDFRRSVRLEGEFKNIEQIGNVTVKSKNNKSVLLKDIADIEFDFEETESYSRTLEGDVITLEIKKRSGENLLKATDKIKDIVAEAKERKLPKNLKVEFTNDTSRMTRLQIENLENSIISGVILVVLVLLFFLGLRNAAFVGVAIPLSMLTGFVILSATGNTLNMMVLFSLILALGMLVDNGIVVVENIYRLMQEGKDGETAAKEGVGEVAWPIISSTMTTLAAFLPLLFWDDIMGEFMKYLPMTLIIVLSSSLFVALVINPVLTSMLMRVESDDEFRTKLKKRQWIGLGATILIGTLCHLGGSTFWGNLILLIPLVSLLNILVLNPLARKFRAVTLPRLESGYDRVIRFALHKSNPIFLFIGMFLLLFVVNVLYSSVFPPKSRFTPDNMPNYINVFIELPTGTDIERTNEVTKEIEGRVSDALQPYIDQDVVLIESRLTNIGKGTSDPNTGEVSNNPTPHKSKILVSFVEFPMRTITNTTTDVMDEVRQAVAGFPGAKITVDKDPAGPPTGPPIAVELVGEKYDKLIELRDDIMKLINNSGIEGIEELKSDLDNGKPEILIKVDRIAAQKYGLSTAQIAGAIRTGLFGKEVSKYKEGEDEYPINIRLKDDQRYDLGKLLNQKISFKDQNTGNDYSIPISAVADVRYSSTLGQVNRKDLDRMILVYSNVTKGYNSNTIIEQLKELFADYKLPDGYEIRFGGEFEQQEETMAFLMNAFIIAILLIFLIIVSQFNSLSAPVIIMFSVLFSTIGVMIGLMVFQMEVIGLMMGIGIISLAGVVVNNAIVLIDYTNLVRDRKKLELGIPMKKRLPKELIIESIVEGGKTRLRPVLLTAITTVLGLIPLAVGFNINFTTLLSEFDPQIYFGGDNTVYWGPMSWTVIFGLTFATFLTLVVVPIMYLLFERAGDKMEALMASGD